MLEIFSKSPGNRERVLFIGTQFIILYTFHFIGTQFSILYTFHSSCPGFWTLEILICSNVIIRKAQKAIQTGDCLPRLRSSPRFPSLTPTRVSFESGTC
jgi:hypothetical protein